VSISTEDSIFPAELVSRSKEKESNLSQEVTARRKRTIGRTNILLLLSTCKDLDEAKRIAKALVDTSLASCVNIAKIDSIYRWKDQVEESKEYILIAKTESSLYGEAEKRIRALHSYELPEIIALSVEGGYPPYLDWIRSNVRLQSG